MPCYLITHLQESLYDQYQQRELTLQGNAEPDVSPGRLAALTQQCVKQITSLPAPQEITAAAGRVNVIAAGISVQAPGISQLATSIDLPERDLFLPPTVTDTTLSGPAGPSASKVSSCGSLLGTALSRSVAVVGQLAQHVKGGRGTQRPRSSISRQEERPVITVAHKTNSGDSFQQAVIGAAIHQTLKIQGLSKSEQIATIELMQQAGVISR